MPKRIAKIAERVRMSAMICQGSLSIKRGVVFFGQLFFWDATDPERDEPDSEEGEEGCEDGVNQTENERVWAEKAGVV